MNYMDERLFIKKPNMKGIREDVDYGLIERLAHLQCTDYEIAYALGVSPQTFSIWKTDEKDTRVADAIERGGADGKMSLRRAQFAVAMPDEETGYRGNPSMLIWLGKQVLHQSDEIKIGGSGKEPVKVQLSWADVPNTIYTGDNHE